MAADFRTFARAAGLLCAIAVGLAAASAQARIIPFSEMKKIETAFFGAEFIEPADMDGDGDTDLLGAAFASGDLVWWENRAGDAATWTPHLIEGNFTGAVCIRAADMDGDGDLDVIAAAHTLGRIAWWENTDGTGRVWTFRLVDGNVPVAQSVAAADLDRDGDLDLVSASMGADAVYWWENMDGRGTLWARYGVGSNYMGAGSVAVADINGDGAPDVLCAAYLFSEIAWWQNPGNPRNAWTKRSLFTDTADQLRAVSAADMDRDGDLDFLCVGYLSADVMWWQNVDGAGTVWVRQNVDGALTGAWALRAADLDGDGDLDLAAAGYATSTVVWYENTNGAGTAWTRRIVDTGLLGPIDVAPADLDGDGDTDLAGASRFSGHAGWWPNRTLHRNAVYPTEHGIGDSFAQACDAKTADLDGDGDLDILAAAYQTGEVAWWQNVNSRGTWWQKRPVAARCNGAWAVESADLDGDGDLDVLAAGVHENALRWWENSTGWAAVWTTRTIEAGVGEARAVAAADIDRDGDMDVAAALSASGKVVWWENGLRTGGGWTRRTVDGNFTGAWDVAAADLDRDGDIDLIGAAATANEIAWWENVGGSGTQWTKRMLSTSFVGAHSVAAADLNGDGRLDVLGTSFAGNRIVWWENPGNTGAGWPVHTVSDMFTGAQSAIAADLDQDGDLDIAVAGNLSPGLLWFENQTGRGDAWTTRTAGGVFAGAIAAAAADLDGDGDFDLLGAAFQGNKIAWVENRGGQFTVPAEDIAPPFLFGGRQDAVLRITIVHNGRAGDGDLELVSLGLLFEAISGVPLSSTEANAIIQRLRLYRDSGSGAFEIPNDILVATIEPLNLSSGVQLINFADGDPRVRVVFGTPQSFFAVIEMTAGAASAPTNPFRVIHQPVHARAEDRVYDIQLTQEETPDAASRWITIETPPTVVSVQPAETNPTSRATVRFAVVFSEPVTGVDVSDFALATSGVSEASILRVTGAGSVHTATVATGSGNGRLRLDVLDNDTILDSVALPLGGVGEGNGSFSGGRDYRVDKTPPTAPGTPRDAGAYSSSTTVRFDWAAANDVGSSVVAYQLRVGTTRGARNVFEAWIGNALHYSITGADGHTLYARVRARDAAGNVGPWSGDSDGIRIDTVPPRLANAGAPNAYAVDVVFNEPVGGADQVSHYVLTRGLPVYHVQAISASQYRLHTGGQRPYTSYTVTVLDGVRDRAGNRMDPHYRSRAIVGATRLAVNRWELYR
ncbi:MAG: FG-GAP-like repeat-containing protein [Candidatus Sumerlaeia bacterium]|nr:FG-GAP-like repeat-containing protein [Candidatus Sumerlaeia bacterium]